MFNRGNVLTLTNIVDWDFPSSQTNKTVRPSEKRRSSYRGNDIYNFIYTIFQEGYTFGMKAILPCGPLNIKHMKNKLYTYIQLANTNSAHCLS